MGRLNEIAESNATITVGMSHAMRSSGVVRSTCEQIMAANEPNAIPMPMSSGSDKVPF